MDLGVLIDSLSDEELDRLQELIKLKRNEKQIMEDFYNGNYMTSEEFKKEMDKYFANLNR